MLRLIIAVLLICNVVLAQAETMGNSIPVMNKDKHLEISAVVGPNRFNTKDTHLIISPTEKDKIHQSTISNNAAWKIGVGYYLNMPAFDHSFLEQLLLELNLYHIKGTLHGHVLQYGLAQFNNYYFSAPFTSTRFMLDVKPTVFVWQRVSGYVIGGVGTAWNKIAYHETAASDIPPNSALWLSHHTYTHLSWDIGAGIKIKLLDHLSATAEYIYAFLGDGTPARGPIPGVRFSAPPHFSFQTQSVLFGLQLNV